MSISYSIVKKHGGFIDVMSEQGKGTEFITSIPLQSTDLKMTEPTVQFLNCYKTNTLITRNQQLSQIMRLLWCC